MLQMIKFLLIVCISDLLDKLLEFFGVYIWVSELIISCHVDLDKRVPFRNPKLLVKQDVVEIRGPRVQLREVLVEFAEPGLLGQRGTTPTLLG